MADCSKTEVFFKELKRMCKDYRKHSDCSCFCPFRVMDKSGEFICYFEQDEISKDAIRIVQEWSDEHPIKTRQSEFLKMFPNAKLTDGRLNICPKLLDTKIENCPMKVCDNCKKEYWLSEVE